MSLKTQKHILQQSSKPNVSCQNNRIVKQSLSHCQSQSSNRLLLCQKQSCHLHIQIVSPNTVDLPSNRAINDKHLRTATTHTFSDKSNRGTKYKRAATRSRTITVELNRSTDNASAKQKPCCQNDRPAKHSREVNAQQHRPV